MQHSLHIGAQQFVGLAIFHAQLYRIIQAAIANNVKCHDEMIDIRSNPFEIETGL